MKESWEVKKLGEICDFQNGFAYKSKLFKENGLPILRISNIQNDGISYKKLVFFNDKDYKEDFNRYKVLKGDLVIAMSGATTGKLAICDRDETLYLNQRVGKFQPKRNLSNKYLYYFLSTKIAENLRISVGSAQPNLSTEQIKTILLPFPPLSEQKRIVSILDKAFDAIEKAKVNAEKNLKNSKEIFESYLQNVFANPGENWEEKKLSEICEKITDGTHQTPKYFDNGFIFLSSRNVTSGKIDWDKIKYIDEKQHLEMHKRVAPKINDILLAKNGTTGVAAMVDRDVDFDIYVSLALLRAKEMVEPNFLLYFVNSPVAKKQFNKRLKGMGVPNLHLEEIREVVSSLPKSLSEQKSIVKKLNNLEAQKQKLKKIYVQKLNNLEELKKSLLQKAFNGEL